MILIYILIYKLNTNLVYSAQKRKAMGQGLCCADNSQTTGNFYSMNIENQRYGRKRPEEIGRNHFNRKFSERELSPEARVVRDYRKQVRRPMLRG